MRDIVYKRVSKETEPVDSKQDTPHISSLPPVREASWYQKTVKALNESVGGIQYRFRTRPAKQQIIAKPTLLTIAEKSLVLKPVKVSTRQKVVASTHYAKQRLKTTHGKLLVAHTLALVVLMGIVVWQYRSDHTHTATSPSPTATSLSARQYLPLTGASSGNTTSQAFADSSATLPRPNLQLYSWVTPWNAATVAQNRDSYSGVSAFWLTVGSDGVSLTPKADWSTWDSFAQAQQRAGQSLYLSVTGDPNTISSVLVNPTLEQQQIKNLLDTVLAHKFDGIDIDFEGLGSSNRDLFTNYVQTLVAAFHSSNKKVAITLEARAGNNVPMDWHAIGLVADEVRIMAYDYHSQTTAQPGPIAPLAWVQEVTSYAVSEVNPSKVIIGLGNYGYDWQAPSTPGGSWTGVGISQEKAVAQAAQYNVPIVRMTGIDENGYDIGSIPSYTYTDAAGNQHQVWFEDAQSLNDKLKVVSQYPIKGVIFWSVGLGDPSFWSSQSSQ